MRALHVHLYKSISYRVLSVMITFVISLALTGNMSIAGSIAGIDAVIKFVVYFLHERAWGKGMRWLKSRS
jgi:uncharacterized membrane protein